MNIMYLKKNNKQNNYPLKLVWQIVFTFVIYWF